MDFLKKNKMAIGGGIILVLAVWVYFTYFSGGSSATLTASDTNTTVTANLLVTLQNLHTIKLDNSIFSNPVFVSLTDFGVTIPPENVGRRNPFIPLVSSGGTKSGLQLPATH